MKDLDVRIHCNVKSRILLIHLARQGRFYSSKRKDESISLLYTVSIFPYLMQINMSVHNPAICANAKVKVKKGSYCIAGSTPID